MMTFTTRPITVHADWQILGDGDLRTHLLTLLQAGVDAGSIDSFKIVQMVGDQLVWAQFEAVMQMDASMLNDPYSAAKTVLDAIVYDIDVRILWISNTFKIAETLVS